MPIVIIELGPPISEERLAAFEQTLPGPLPADYRSFMATSNGGRPERNWWPPERGDGDFDVNRFFSLDDPEKTYALQAWREMLLGRVPDHLLVFADDTFGNQLCLSLADADHGHVYFFDHELEVDDDEEPHPDLLTPVVTTFTEFMEVLQPDPGDEEAFRRYKTLDALKNADPAPPREDGMPIVIIELGPVISEERLTTFEQTLPGPLPTDYRSFMATSNGGWPQGSWWPPERGDGDFVFDNFLSLNEPRSYASLEDTREDFKGRIPDHLLVFARDTFGNQLCLSLAATDHGYIYFFDHELKVNDDEEPHPDLLTPLATTFTEFVKTLQPKPGREELRRHHEALDAARAGANRGDGPTGRGHEVEPALPA